MIYKLSLTISTVLLALSLGYYIFRQEECNDCFDAHTKSDNLAWLSPDNENIYLVTKKESYERVNIVDFDITEDSEIWAYAIVTPNLGYEYTPSENLSLPRQKSAALMPTDQNNNLIDLNLISHKDLVGQNLFIELESKSLSTTTVSDYFLTNFEIIEWIN